MPDGATVSPTVTVLPTEADPVHAEIQALYEEARDIRDQLNRLVERLAILMQRTRSD
jgi:ubiquinone biosynthesis protein UbiJ